MNEEWYVLSVEVKRNGMNLFRGGPLHRPHNIGQLGGQALHGDKKER
jgi:hypothetical protein